MVIKSPLFRTPPPHTHMRAHSIGKFKKHYMECYMGLEHCTVLAILTTIMTYVPTWQSFRWSLLGPSFLLLDVLDTVQGESTLECTDLLADNEVRLATECFLTVELWLQEDTGCLHRSLAVPPASYHHLSPFPSDKHKSRNELKICTNAVPYA